MPNLAWSNASAAHSAQDALDDVCSAMPRLTSGVAVDRRKSCSVQSGSPTISSSWLVGRRSAGELRILAAPLRNRELVRQARHGLDDIERQGRELQGMGGAILRALGWLIEQPKGPKLIVVPIVKSCTSAKNCASPRAYGGACGAETRLIWIRTSPRLPSASKASRRESLRQNVLVFLK